MTEEDFESKAHITKHMTGSKYDLLRERTDVNSAEELRYGHFNHTLAKLLWPGFGVAPEVYFEYKVSKDRGSRSEDVEVLKGMYEPERGFYSGSPLVAEAIMDMDENRTKRRRLKEL